MQLYSKEYQNPQDHLPETYDLILGYLSFIDSPEFEDSFQKNPHFACQRGCDYLNNMLSMVYQEFRAKKNEKSFFEELRNINRALKQAFQRLSNLNENNQPTETKTHVLNQESVLRSQPGNEQFTFQQQNHSIIGEHEILQNLEPLSVLEKQSIKTNTQSLLPNSLSSDNLREYQEKEEYILKSPQVKKNPSHPNGSPKDSNKVTSLKKEEEEVKLSLNQISNQTSPPRFKPFQCQNSNLNLTSQYATQPKYKRENLNRGLQNLGETCYFNSLLQSWYHIKLFRDSVLCATDCSPLFVRLQTFFTEMQYDSEYLDSTHEGLVHEMFAARKDQFKLHQKGDSGVLFQALIEVLSDERDAQTIPYLKTFLGGILLKTRRCQDCPAVKEIQEPFKLLEVRDCDFTKDKMETYFQPRFETRTCKCTSQQPVFEYSYSATNLPKILAIRIHDTHDNFERVRVLEEITFQELQAASPGKEFSEVKYRFITGIFNTCKGKDGGHSVEISKHYGKYFEFDDLSLDDISYIDYISKHPKVLYYQRV